MHGLGPFAAHPCSPEAKGARRIATPDFDTLLLGYADWIAVAAVSSFLLACSGSRPASADTAVAGPLVGLTGFSAVLPLSQGISSASYELHGRGHLSSR